MIISDLSVLEVAFSDANVEGGSDLQLNVAIVGQATVSDVSNSGRGGFGSVSTASIANIYQSNFKSTTVFRRR